MILFEDRVSDGSLGGKGDWERESVGCEWLALTVMAVTTPGSNREDEPTTICPEDCESGEEDGGCAALNEDSLGVGPATEGFVNGGLVEGAGVAGSASEGVADGVSEGVADGVSEGVGERVGEGVTLSGVDGATNGCESLSSHMWPVIV